MASKTTRPQRGGARPGAGRPAGSLNKRSVAAIEAVAEQFPDWSPLQHFATVANDETLDPSIRLDAAKAAAPFIHPRPKPVELDPAALVDLERQLVQVRLTAQDQILHSKPGLADRLARAKSQVLLVTSVERAPDDPKPDLVDGLSERLKQARATQRLSSPEDAAPAGPEPTRANAPVPYAMPSEPYRPMTSTMSDDYSPFSNQD